MDESGRAGPEYLAAATELLRRVRGRHPTAGLLEAADLQWWWRTPRPTDELPQLFWFDERGQPEGAVIATDWADGVALDPIVLPGATADWVAHVVTRGLGHAGTLGWRVVDVAIDGADDVMRDVLLGRGFTVRTDAALAVAGAWLDVDDRPAISPLRAGYRLASRRDTRPRPHHMTRRSGPQVETRLRQTSLYRAELDLVVLDRHDGVAAYGLFWLDPESATGLVEPMRTEDDHQRRGLARHLLTAGLDALAAMGARRVKVCFRPGDPAASSLYRSTGFESVQQTVVLTGPNPDRPL